GREVRYAVFSPCNKSLPEGYPKDYLFQELNEAASVLGIKEEAIYKFNFPVREFPKYRQEILEELVKISNEFNPELVILPCSTDIHQDHHQLYLEGVRAFKYTNVIGYELYWNTLVATTNFHIRLEEQNIKAKVNAILKYKSQKARPYVDEDLIRNQAIMRGAQVKNKYAEAYEFIRWIE
ncbi:MAG: PIG-L family deacetylase, partial [Bacteroidota bacterium]